MYVGRLLVAAPGPVGAYRVSSRSFPNREIVDRGDRLTVEPTAEAAPTDNPYVSYNCVRIVGTPTTDCAVLGNGSHVDPIAEKLTLGYPARDALATGLLALDFEKDEYDTPRIAGVLVAGEGDPTVGIVRNDALLVERIAEPTLVATYELDRPEPVAFPAREAAAAARTAYEFEYEHPVCAAGVALDEQGSFETAVLNEGSS